MTLLAIVAIHTAANEPPEVRQVMNKIHRNVGGHDDDLRRDRGGGAGRELAGAHSGPEAAAGLALRALS